MSLLFSHENCSLISHENFINQIYNECASASNETEPVCYKIRSDLFDLNVPYRQKTDDEIHTKKRHRKVINKTSNLVAEEHPDEYALV